MECSECKERPGVTEDGTFYCGAVGEETKDSNSACEYFQEGK